MASKRLAIKHWSLPQAAKELKVSHEYVWKLVKTGKIRAVKHKGQWRLSAKTVEVLQRKRVAKGVMTMPRKSYSQVVEELQDAEQALDDVADVLTDDSLDADEQLDSIADTVGVDTEEEEENKEEDD